MTVLEVADLSKVWVLFDVYESDMNWIKVGDKVSFTVQSIPGESFEGKLAFIDPIINPQTRVAKARIEFFNNNMKLKPEMFALGSIASELKNENSGIAVPKSAVMWTGERSVVYVKNDSPEGVNFEMRIVTLGPSLEDSYFIKSGLEIGEEIVVNGTFSVDAAAQLSGKPSMMNPEGGPAMTGHNHGNMPENTVEKVSQPKSDISINNNTKEKLAVLFNEYIELKDALVADDIRKSKESASTFLVKLKAINMNDFEGSAHAPWMQYNRIAHNALGEIVKMNDLNDGREQFKLLSDQMIILAKTFKPLKKTLYVIYCPMANSNKGADWLSEQKTILNPYMGNKMLRCGDLKETINAQQ